MGRIGGNSQRDPGMLTSLVVSFVFQVLRQVWGSQWAAGRSMQDYAMALCFTK